MKRLRVLIGGETSGKVRDAFIRKGHDAVSCDLLPSEAPGPHHQGDMFDIIGDGWDLGIFHPSCTFLSSSGLHWNRNPASPRFGGKQTEAALDDVRRILAAPIPHIAVENPTGCISTRIRPADQYVQPYQFGDDASKKTGLWLVNLPRLEIDPLMRRAGRMVEWPLGSGRMVERWANQTDSGQNKLAPSADRWKLRSETYAGIAEAFTQWGDLLELL
jgi:hypothetical protein